MWHPWRELRFLTDVVYGVRADIPSGDSWWVPESRMILMRPGMLQVERRCALTHELGHRELGIPECVPPEGYADASRQERREEFNVDSWAAHKLIEFADLERVGQWATCRDEAAEELWVTRKVLDVRLYRLAPWERRMLALQGVDL